MKAIRQKTIFVFLVIVLALSAATNGAALTTVSCTPQACRRLNTDARNAPIDDHGFMRSVHHCAPTTPAPCCRLKSVQAKANWVIASRPKIFTHRTVVIMPPLEYMLPKTQHFTTRTPILEDERIRAPLLPIYLLTLTILC